MRTLSSSLLLTLTVCALALGGCEHNPAPRPDYRVKVMPTADGRGSIAIPPDCATYAKAQMGDPWTNVASPHYGCATAQNLAAQVADPNDLIEGKTDGSPDPITTAATIARYQAGKTTALIDPNSNAPAQIIKMEDARVGGASQK